MACGGQKCVNLHVEEEAGGLFYWCGSEFRLNIYFSENPQHKQNQSPAVTQTTSEVEIHDYTLSLSVSTHKLILKKDHEYSFCVKLLYNLSHFSGPIFQSGNDVRFHYYCHMPYESYHYWMQDLPLLVASGTSVHLLWWALPVVGFALCVWSMQIHMIHTHSRRWAPILIATTNLFLLYNEEPPFRAYSPTADHMHNTTWTWCPSSPLSIMRASELMAELMTWRDNVCYSKWQWGHTL